MMIAYERQAAHLLRLCDEPLLQRLDLGQHLVGARVRALELAPAVGVVRVLELLRERAHLGPVLQQLALQRVDFSAQRLHIGAARVLDLELSAQRLRLEP